MNENKLVDTSTLTDFFPSPYWIRAKKTVAVRSPRIISETAKLSRFWPLTERHVHFCVNLWHFSSLSILYLFFFTRKTRGPRTRLPELSFERHHWSHKMTSHDAPNLSEYKRCIGSRKSSSPLPEVTVHLAKEIDNNNRENFELLWTTTIIIKSFPEY